MSKIKYICLFVLAASVSAYEFKPGDWIVRGVLGPSINVVREDNAGNRNTPGAGAMLGAELEYVFDKGWSATAALRPVFAPSYVDLGFGAGVKYRWLGVADPFVPYATLALTPAFLIPTGVGAAHFNLGLRPSIGADYFIVRNVAVGLEIAMDPSLLAGSSYRWVELSIDIVLGVTWRI